MDVSNRGVIAKVFRSSCLKDGFKFFYLMVVFFTLLLSFGCSKNNANKFNLVRCNISSFKNFDTIFVAGDSRVNLARGPYKIEMLSEGAACSQYINTAKGGVLNVRAKKGEGVIKITSPALKKIVVSNNGVVKAKNFLSDGLSIEAYDNSIIDLEGRFVVNKIYQRGGAKINLGWVDSDVVYVDVGGSGSICLYGVAAKMVAKLSNNVSVNARYLRAKTAGVFAENLSQITITPLNSLKAFAKDKSKIFYYNRPKNLDIVSRDFGNVLQLGWVK